MIRKWTRQRGRVARQLANDFRGCLQRREGVSEFVRQHAEKGLLRAASLCLFMQVALQRFNLRAQVGTVAKHLAESQEVALRRAHCQYGASRPQARTVLADMPAIILRLPRHRSQRQFMLR